MVLVAPPECYSNDFAARKACRLACTLATCPLKLSYWAYLPSLPANGLFTALFSISLILYLVQAVWSRRFIGFSVAMLCGSILEVLGYVGRLLSYNNPFQQLGFLLQIICLTIAPAFYAAGLYFCLSRIVLTFGAENSRISPRMYPRIFIPCDFFSLVLQAAGGGQASAATHASKDPTLGNNLMIAGLSFQVFTLALFIALSADFAWKTYSRVRQLGQDGALDPTHAKLRASLRFRGFLAALVFATLCIFTRSVYRVAELSEGWSGHLISTQRYFIGLEGAIVAAAVLALNAFHPAFCFAEGHDVAQSDKAQLREEKRAAKSVGSDESGVGTPREKVADAEHA